MVSLQASMEQQPCRVNNKPLVNTIKMTVFGRRNIAKILECPKTPSTDRSFSALKFFRQCQKIVCSHSCKMKNLILMRAFQHVSTAAFTICCLKLVKLPSYLYNSKNSQFSRPFICSQRYSSLDFDVVSVHCTGNALFCPILLLKTTEISTSALNSTHPKNSKNSQFSRSFICSWRYSNVDFDVVSVHYTGNALFCPLLLLKTTEISTSHFNSAHPKNSKKRQF